MNDPSRRFWVFVSCSVVFLAAVENSFKITADQKKDGEVPKVELADPHGDLSGLWRCRGVEANGKTYRGVVSIERKNQVYVVRWAAGTETFAGIGIRRGDAFAVSWTIKGSPAFGVNLYRIDGKRMIGSWAALPGDGSTAEETLTFLEGLE